MDNGTPTHKPASNYNEGLTLQDAVDSILDTFTIEKVIRKNTKNKKRSTVWTFHPSTAFDIRFEEVVDELTKKNPLAFIERSDHCWVAVHRSITDKGFLCGVKGSPNPMISTYNNGELFNCQKSDFPKWVQWVKMVRDMPWDKSAAHNACVTVSLPQL